MNKYILQTTKGRVSYFAINQMQAIEFANSDGHFVLTILSVSTK